MQGIQIYLMVVQHVVTSAPILNLYWFQMCGSRLWE